jgi:CRP-like cAMP-binding protein
MWTIQQRNLPKETFPLHKHVLNLTMDVFSNLKPKIVSKGTILLHKGEVCSVAFKVVKGCLKSYVIDKSGKEHILQFAPEGWLISDMDSFVNNTCSTTFIDAIEDSEVLILSKPTLGHISELDKEVLVEQNEKLLRNLISTNKRLVNLLSASAEERYVDFTKAYPTLLQRLPLKLTASYLGMTPEYLSDVRRRIAKR